LFFIVAAEGKDGATPLQRDSEYAEQSRKRLRYEPSSIRQRTLSAAVLDELKVNNLTVAQTYWYLPAAEPVLGDATVAGVKKTLQTLRAAGVKAVISIRMYVTRNLCGNVRTFM